MLIPSLVSAQNSSELMARWDVDSFWFLWMWHDPHVAYYNGAGANIDAVPVTGNNISMGTDENGFVGYNWPTSSTTPDYSKYFQFTVSPKAGKNLQPKNFRLQQDGACGKFQVRYSTDPSFPGNGTLLYQSNNAYTTQDQYINMTFPADVVIPSGQTLYVRVYGYHRQGTSSAWRINSYSTWYWNYTIDGPEFYGTTTNSLVANPDTATTLVGQPVSINVTANDVATNTTISSVSIVSAPSQGTAVVQPNNTITYTPGLLTLGNVTFQYQITAANGATATATVTVTVSPLVNPVAVNDTVTLIKNTTADINVLSNDIPGSGLISIVTISGTPMHGSVSVNNNMVYYTPDADYTGTDSFTYIITDVFNNTSTATVNLVVNEPVLPAPGSNDGVYCASSTTWNGTQWSNGEPNAEKDAIIAADYTKNAGTLIACSLYVTGDADVIFKNNSNARITYNVNVAETASLTFESNCNLIQIQNTPNVGEVTVKRFGSKLKRLDYTFWSSPVTGNQTLLDFSPDTMPDRFYIYNTAEQQYMSVPPATTTFTPARGYLIRMPNAITGPQATPYAQGIYRFSFEGVFTGVPNNGDIQIPLQYYGENGRYNSVGNPYPSPISATDFILANIDNIEGTLWIWRKTNNPNATSYCTLTTLGFIANNALGGGGTGGSDGNDLIADPFTINPGGVLNTGQGFIVKSKTNQPLVFTNSMRRSNNFASFFRSENEQGTEQEENAVVASRIWLNVSKNDEEGSFAQTLIGYTSLATLDYDNGIDGMLMPGGAVNLYSVIDSGNLSIQGRPDFTNADVVHLGFKAQSAGDFTFAIDHVDGLFEGEQEIYLKDNQEGTTHNLKESSYTFASEAGTFDNRFEIVYTTESLGTAPAIMDENTVIVYSSDNRVGIKSAEEIKSITVFDVSGRMIYRNPGINDANFLSPLFSNQQQVIVLKIEFKNGATANRKIIL